MGKLINLIIFISIEHKGVYIDKFSVLFGIIRISKARYLVPFRMSRDQITILKSDLILNLDYDW